MSELLKPARAYLESEDWTFDEVDGRDALVCRVTADSASFQVVFDAVEELRFLLVYVLAQVSIPVERRPEVALYLARANYGMRIGNFELDLDDGEVRYKASIALGDGALTPGMVGELVGASVTTMDRYFSGLMSVGFGTSSAYDACRIAEADVT